MSATRMLVLGAIKMSGEAHGYQVRRMLQQWSADRWANVQPGSIYHALKALAKDELIEPTGTESAEGPARTTYRVTDTGDRELMTMLGGALADSSVPVDQLSASVALLPLVPRKQAIVMLRSRLTGLEAQVTPTSHLVGAFPEMGKPAHVSELARLWLTSLEGQVKWTRELLQRLEAGEYDLTD